MTKYASKDFKDLKVGISSFSDGKTSLEVIGRLGVNTSTSENAVDVVGSVNISEDLYVSGVSTFVGVGTFVGDLHVGGNLNVVGDLVYDEVTGRNLNITGVATVGTAFTVNGPSNLVDTFVSGALTATTFTGAGTGLTGITSATNATNIYGGATGQLLYQAQPGLTSAFENGATGQGLFSRGPGQPPQWLSAAPAGAIEGVLIFDEGGAVGLGTTYSGIDFRGLDVTATGGNNGGIATVTVVQQTYVNQAGVSTSVVGGAASVTQLNVDVGISSFADFKITSSGVGATVGASAGITTYYGRGTELTGIVTTITAGPNIAIDQSIGNVTITGLADTSVVVSDSLFVAGITTLNTVSANSLIVSGITTLGVVTGATYYGNGNNLTGIVTSLIAGANISLSGSQGEVTITGLANTANVVAESLVVTGVSTLGIITGAESIGVTTIYTENIVGGTATFSGNVTIGGTLTYEDVSNVDSVGFVTARSGLNVGYSTGPSGIGATILPDGNAAFAGIVTSSGGLIVGSATSQFSVISSGSTIMVGIGTTNPLHTLDVRGDTNIEGSLTINNNTVPSLAMVIALGGL
jgi:hypothetical protein